MSSPLFGMVIMLFSTLVIFLFGILFKGKYKVVRYVLCKLAVNWYNC
jgi:hypothetical protein